MWRCPKCKRNKDYVGDHVFEDVCRFCNVEYEYQNDKGEIHGKTV